MCVFDSQRRRLVGAPLSFFECRAFTAHGIASLKADNARLILRNRVRKKANGGRAFKEEEEEKSNDKYLEKRNTTERIVGCS